MAPLLRNLYLCPGCPGQHCVAHWPRIRSGGQNHETVVGRGAWHRLAWLGGVQTTATGFTIWIIFFFSHVYTQLPCAVEPQASRTASGGRQRLAWDWVLAVTVYYLQHMSWCTLDEASPCRPDQTREDSICSYQTAVSLVFDHIRGVGNEDPAWLRGGKRVGQRVRHRGPMQKRATWCRWAAAGSCSQASMARRPGLLPVPSHLRTTALCDEPCALSRCMPEKRHGKQCSRGRQQ